MQEKGKELRRAREEKGLTLEEVSSRTLVAKKYLSALEEGRIDMFPGEVYFKGALRKYAQEVGLNPETLLAGYGSEKPAEQKEKIIAEAAKHKKQARAGSAAAPVKVVRSTRRVNKGRLAMIAMILALLVVGVYAIGSMIASDSPEVTDPPPAADNGLQQPEPQEPAPEPEPEPPAPPQIRVEQDGQNRFVVYNAEVLELELSFTERSWVRVHTDGSQLFEDTFSATQSRPFTALESARVRTGNAYGTRLTVNGEAIALSEDRAPVTVEIISGGME